MSDTFSSENYNEQQLRINENYWASQKPIKHRKKVHRGEKICEIKLFDKDGFKKASVFKMEEKSFLCT